MPVEKKKTATNKKKRPLLVPGEHNTLTGKQLHDMGKYVTDDGYLIAATLKYDVFLPAGTIQWIIKLK
jgi:hypothetical protein